MAYEYRIETFAHADGRYNARPTHSEVLARLNELGAEGWMVVPTPALDSGILLAREKRED